MAEDWERYARTVIASMREVLAEAKEEHHPLLLEAADYWLALGISLGLERPDDARRLLALAEPQEDSRAELAADAKQFVLEALG